MIKYDNIELIMIPLDQKDDQGDLILPDDFNEEWREILLLSRSDSN